MTDLNKLRSEFEAIPEIKPHLDHGNVFWSDKNQAYASEFQCLHVAACYVNGAWFMFQEKAKAQEVPEGYALVSKDKLHEWYCMANRSEELGCPECYESRGYAHNLACELNEASESGAEG